MGGFRNCARSAKRDGAQAITELLARAEAAEARAEEWKATAMANDETELSKAHDALSADWAKQKIRAKELEEQLGKAEKERDAAIKELDGVSSAVDDLADFVDREIHPVIDYNLYLDLRENVDAISAFQYESEWRGIKEE